LSDQSEQPEAPRAQPRGEAAWKAHRQAIAERNDQARAAGKQDRREREQRAAQLRRAQEDRIEADFASKPDSHYD
jgi:hypothetical protein